MKEYDIMIQWYLNTPSDTRIKQIYNLNAEELEDLIEFTAENMYTGKPYYIYETIYNIATTIRFCKSKYTN